MVGLVVVSHSRALAAGVAELVGGVSDIKIPIAFAGGTGTDHRELGTDAMDIMEAIQAVDNPQGTVVLMDLGSAILSAETAVEFLADTLQGPVRLIPAPLVEGAVSAAVQIGLEADIDLIVAEAWSALAPKEKQLAPATDHGEGVQSEPAGRRVSTGVEGDQPRIGSDGARQTFSVETKHGLHARPAAQLVRRVGQFSAEAMIRRVDDGPDHWVNARSLNRIATLQLRRGDTFELWAQGEDAKQLLSEVEQLVSDNFGEPRHDDLGGDAEPDSSSEHPETATPVTMNDWAGTVTGVPASQGLALGPAFILSTAHVSIDPESTTPRNDILDATEAQRQLEPVVIARNALADELRREASEADRQGNVEAGGIARAHETLLLDPELEEEALKILRERLCTAAEAYWIATVGVAQEYRQMADPYLRARAADVRDVAVRMMQAVAPDQVQRTVMPQEPAIVVADDLLPSQMMRLDPEVARGIVTVYGTGQSHAAIIARGLGIPMVTGVALAPDWEETLGGAVLVVNGDVGSVEVGPDEARQTTVSAEIAVRQEESRRQRDLAQRPGALADGTTIPIYANVATVADAERAAANGADGVGLLRTEFIFLSATAPPDEEEQVAALAAMTESFGELPVVIRLLDIGGDKSVPYLSLPREANPFLGVRGVRLLLTESFRDLLRIHLRALLRVASEKNVKLMVPMVTEVRELSAVHLHLEAAHQELSREGVSHRWPVPVGSMIETPAAALRAADLARKSAFFSVGTNDLTQYVMAVERGNESMTHLSDGLHPAVLDAIRHTVDGARTQGIPVSICGELGSDPAAIPILIGLGAEALSVNPASVALTKDIVSRLHHDQCRQRAVAAGACTTADEVRQQTPSERR